MITLTPIMSLVLKIFAAFIVLLIIIVYVALSLPHLLEERRRKRSQYTVLIEDYSSGTLVKRIDYANKFKLENSDTYMLGLLKGKKYVPLPTEAKVENKERFKMFDNLPDDGKWEKIKKKGLKEVRDASDEPEPLMGLYKGRLLIPLVTKNGHDFFYKKQIDKDQLDELDDQVISESRKLLIENILRHLHNKRKNKVSIWDKYGTHFTVAFIFVIGCATLIYGWQTQRSIAGQFQKDIIVNFDGQMLNEYLNNLNLTYDGQPVDKIPVTAPPG